MNNRKGLPSSLASLLPPNVSIEMTEDDGGSGKYDAHGARKVSKWSKWGMIVLMLILVLGVYQYQQVRSSRDGRKANYLETAAMKRAVALGRPLRGFPPSQRPPHPQQQGKQHEHEHEYEQQKPQHEQKAMRWGDNKELTNVPFEEYSPHGRYRWSSPILLPPIPGSDDHLMERTLQAAMSQNKNGRGGSMFDPLEKAMRRKDDFHVSRQHERFEWDTYEGHALPKVDYTKWRYRYPELMARPPVDDPSLYPPLQTLGRILNRWPQDDLDRPPDVLEETLMHFDYSDPMERAAAVRFRDAELPFKVYNVPELDEATAKWADDDYVGRQFAGHKIHGVAQESTDHFFSFFRNDNWNVEVMGPPPSVDTDFSFTQWARHARFADTFGLDPQSTHYYWQSGVPQNERFHSQRTWSFVSKDLPSFSDTEPNFFAFNPKEQKGIQCRFGERGVVAATHYDSGRNMVAMITGAKRYILSPPKACGKLGIIAHRKHPAFRHSLLNFGHITPLPFSMIPHRKPCPCPIKNVPGWNWLKPHRLSIPFLKQVKYCTFLPIGSITLSVYKKVPNATHGPEGTNMGRNTLVEARMSNDVWESNINYYSLCFYKYDLVDI